MYPYDSRSGNSKQRPIVLHEAASSLAYKDLVKIDPTDTTGFRVIKTLDPNEAIGFVFRNMIHHIGCHVDIEYFWRYQSGGGGSGQTQITEKIPISISAGQVGTYVNVPLTNITSVSDVVTMNQNLRVVSIDWRLTGGGSGVQIRSNSAATYTIHVEGYS